jgi:D-serine dehydratase
MTRPDRAATSPVSADLNNLGATVLDHRFKGIPLGTSLPLSEIGGQGWNVARGDLALPVTTLRESALQNNLAVMARYCDLHGALLAPHGKTTMAPQLFRRQLDAGAWGMTAATPTQAAVMRQFGVKRIIIANELVEPEAIRWIATEMESDGTSEILSLVDNVGAVMAADSALDGITRTRRLPVLLEVGVKGGRAGVRSADQAMRVAEAVATSRHLILAGIEVYEGLITSGAAAADLKAIDDALTAVRSLVYDIARKDLFGTETIMVTAGGSAYFDRVVAMLRDWADLGRPVQLVLRSGCYLTQDLGKYHHVSPLDGRRSAAEPLQLLNALEGWARVLSVPEPDLVILGTGKRDLPYDIELPTPLTAHQMHDGTVTDLTSAATIDKMMDQHAFMKLHAGITLRPGDVVRLGMSHPCTAFDKTRFVPIIDDGNTVIDGILTFF